MHQSSMLYTLNLHFISPVYPKKLSGFPISPLHFPPFVQFLKILSNKIKSMVSLLSSPLVSLKLRVCLL